MSDTDIKQAMRAIAAMTGLTLTDERIERDLPAYKNYLAAMEAIKRIALPLEAEPLPVVALDERRSR